MNSPSASSSTHTAKVLFPTDLSAASLVAFREAERFARALQAKLVVLYVVPPPDYWTSGSDDVEIDAQILAALRAIRPAGDDIPYEHATHMGLAGEVICWIAQAQACDLIVMSTHGHTGLKHLLFGSVAEHVMRHARCPVMTIRVHASDEAPLPEPEVYRRLPPML